MISTRRIVTAVGLAVSVTGLAAPMASAAEADAPAGNLSPIRMLDSLTVSDLPEEHKATLPRPSQQLNQLNQVPGELNQLHQVTDLVAPVTNLLPGIAY
ncbi:hypothetical protein Stsp02_30930 [Streptomyces sp. NBRC 14336]|uniref:hypothetical protein n=1 Tax=Streptomyces sp. NBRC 14336 TaxID=3030992 RepID=UPI0024A31817|nr:hypothetical protein [Streptomyces sp. NBRC 14336]WBO82024.1 hypothetical protein SBE_005918 [Streptomyces sp. SBE_14.2]GLW47431.1 hypothetical protein Stsp02_30930 [Streptomyces sp. NBRC 14336]